MHTRWIETEFDNTIEPYAGAVGDVDAPAAGERVTVEVGGRRLEVVLPAGFGAVAGSGGSAGGSGAGGRTASRRRAAAGSAGSAGSADGTALTSPMQGTVVSIVVEDGQQVAAGDPVLVLEAMKMEQPVTAHRAGVISGLAAEVGATVTSGAILCQIVDVSTS